MGVPSTIGLAPDAPCLPGEWREGSGIGFALAERAAGRPADPLLFALTRHHARMHDGRVVNADERIRLATVLVAPQRPAPVVPMAEAAPDDEAPAELAPRLKRRSRVAEMVPAGKVTGWVPQWRRAEPCAGSGQWAVGSRDAESAAVVPRPSPPQVASPPRALDCAPATARMAGAPAVPPPSAGAPVDAPAPVKTAPAKPPRPKRVPSIKHIIAVAERYAGLAPGGLGLGRAPAVTAARQVAMWLAFTLLQWDLARIGATFGRDRTTVRYAVQAVTERAERDDAFAEALDGLVAEAKREPTSRRRKTAP